MHLQQYLKVSLLLDWLIDGLLAEWPAKRPAWRCVLNSESLSWLKLHREKKSLLQLSVVAPSCNLHRYTCTRPQYSRSLSLRHVCSFSHLSSRLAKTLLIYGLRRRIMSSERGSAMIFSKFEHWKLAAGVIPRAQIL